MINIVEVRNSSFCKGTTHVESGVEEYVRSLICNKRLVFILQDTHCLSCPSRVRAGVQCMPLGTSQFFRHIQL